MASINDVLNFLRNNRNLYILNVIVGLFLFYSFSPNRSFFYRDGGGFSNPVVIVSLIFAVITLVIDCIVYFEKNFSEFKRPFTSIIVANVITVIIDWIKDPTDHNLLPFELLTTTLCSFVLFSVLYGIVRIIRFAKSF